MEECLTCWSLYANLTICFEVCISALWHCCELLQCPSLTFFLISCKLLWYSKKSKGRTSPNVSKGQELTFCTKCSLYLLIMNSERRQWESLSLDVWYKVFLSIVAWITQTYSVNREDVSSDLLQQSPWCLCRKQVIPFCLSMMITV